MRPHHLAAVLAATMMGGNAPPPDLSPGAEPPRLPTKTRRNSHCDPAALMWVLRCFEIGGEHAENADTVLRREVPDFYERLKMIKAAIKREAKTNRVSR